MGNHYFRVRANSLNWINVVLCTTSYKSLYFSLWFGAVTILLRICLGSTIGIRESLISGTPTPLREAEIQQQTHHWKELSVLTVSSPSPSLHLPQEGAPSLPSPHPKWSQEVTLTSYWSSGTDTSQTSFFISAPRETVDHFHHSFVVGFSRIITLYPRESGSAFSHLHTQLSQTRF